MNAKTFACLLVIVGVSVFQTDVQAQANILIMGGGVTDPITDPPPGNETAEIPPGETVTFNGTDGFATSVICAYEFEDKCDWLCLPFVITEGGDAVLPDEGTFTVTSEGEDIVIKNQHSSEIMCESENVPLDIVP